MRLIYLNLLILKIINTKVLIKNWYFRNRNLRIVRRRPTYLSSFQENVTLPELKDIFNIARDCFYSKGYFPISFSWPEKFEVSKVSKTDSISTTVPYVPYSFQNAKDYYESYSIASMAITQKKGGWDCFRHLEIISAGSVPFFLGVKKIPKYTMVHYPKNLFKVVNVNFRSRSLLPNDNITLSLIDYANSNLTCKSMCHYFSELANFDVSSQDSILFVDSRLSSEPDYLSLFNFIGLKQVYGDQVKSLFQEPDYVYKDSAIDVSKLYGRGFGYSKILERSNGNPISVNPPKVIVISNLERDRNILKQLKTQYLTSKFVLFWGADIPIPNSIKENALRVTQGVLFCREIY